MPKLAKEARSALRIKFFEQIFEDTDGWLCLAVTSQVAPKATFSQRFFRWPSELMKAENYILKAEKDHNVYFCVNLLSDQERRKERALPHNILWADLDEVDPVSLPIPPQFVLQTSPGRYQALWKLSMQLQPLQAEDYSRRLAYSAGADKSGWDLTQLLRVPFTKNFKYEGNPEIALVAAIEGEAPPLIFEGLENPDIEAIEIDMPSINDLPSAEAIIYKYTVELRHSAFAATYSQEPSAEADWSAILWRLIHTLFEAGLSAEEVLVVTEQAPCNKYARDNRPVEHLWKEIVKAQQSQENIYLITGDFRPLTMPWLVDEPAHDTFLNIYKDWATEATDAVPAFHDLSCTIMLSSIIANSVRLETSSGYVVPNLWGLILGDSTLTRKSTAMNMATDFLRTLDPEMLMATDGSPEGLLTGLESRPNKVSVFYKDEVSGFFDSINRKDYLAGMPETLTALYDVPPVFTRLLRKSVIRIESPAFIFFGGGVPSRVYESVNDEYVISGFLPRFLMVSGETSIDKLRRMGPPTDIGIAKRASIATEVANIYEDYASDVVTNIGGQPVLMTPRIIATLTAKAWAKYGEIEERLVTVASESSIPDLALPTFERMSRSILKMAIILGAIRQKPKANKIVIQDTDIINATWYVQDWGRYSVDLVANAGKRTSEKLLDKILRSIYEHPGILRSTLMQHHHLTKREADDIFSTLEDRFLIRKEKHGRGHRFFSA